MWLDSTRGTRSRFHGHNATRVLSEIDLEPISVGDVFYPPGASAGSAPPARRAARLSCTRGSARPSRSTTRRLAHPRRGRPPGSCSPATASSFAFRSTTSRPTTRGSRLRLGELRRSRPIPRAAAGAPRVRWRWTELVRAAVATSTLRRCPSARRRWLARARRSRPCGATPARLEPLRRRAPAGPVEARAAVPRTCAWADAVRGRSTTLGARRRARQIRRTSRGRFRAELAVTPMAYLWERRVVYSHRPAPPHRAAGAGWIAARRGFRSAYHFLAPRPRGTRVMPPTAVPALARWVSRVSRPDGGAARVTAASSCSSWWTLWPAPARLGGEPSATPASGVPRVSKKARSRSAPCSSGVGSHWAGSGSASERLQAEELEEQRRRAVEHRAELRAPGLLDEAALELASPSRCLGHDAADARHLGPGRPAAGRRRSKSVSAWAGESGGVRGRASSLRAASSATGSDA